MDESSHLLEVQVKTEEIDVKEEGVDVYESNGSEQIISTLQHSIQEGQVKREWGDDSIINVQPFDPYFGLKVSSDSRLPQPPQNGVSGKKRGRGRPRLCKECRFESGRRGGGRCAHDDADRGRSLRPRSFAFACPALGPRCTFGTNSRRALRTHVHQHAHADARLRCPDCDYVTDSGACLRAHRAHHAATRFFRCSVCVYKTNRPDSLARHALSHAHSRDYIVHITAPQDTEGEQ